MYVPTYSHEQVGNLDIWHTLTERQCEFGHLTGSMSLMPVIVPM